MDYEKLKTHLHKARMRKFIKDINADHITNRPKIYVGDTVAPFKDNEQGCETEQTS